MRSWRRRTVLVVGSLWIAVYVGGHLEGAAVIRSESPEEGVSAQEGRSATVQGEIIDPALYLREGRHGLEAEDLIYKAVDGGRTLALLEEGTNGVYLFLAEESGQDPNDLVYEYAGRRVRVTGTVYKRRGLWGIVARSVELLSDEPLEEPIDKPDEEAETP